ncbi:VOC family protein [Kitasatospora azatica]|uniref:VOC family protein n=1 Tax=Kitasatospora azatica TaxID=58347 RepID=UPI002D21E6CE|nr:VOC family protein [Kitasatospora azatica]
MASPSSTSPRSRDHDLILKRSVAPAAPLAVIQVDDLDATRQAVIEAGGTVTVEAFDFPGGRRIHFREPGGNELAVWVPMSQG